MLIALADIAHVLYDVFLVMIFIRLLNRTSLKRQEFQNVFLKQAGILVMAFLFVLLEMLDTVPVVLLKPVALILFIVFAKIFYRNHFVEDLVITLIYYTTSLVIEHIVREILAQFDNLPYVECISVAMSLLLFFLVSELILANFLDYKDYVFNNKEFIFLFGFGSISFVLMTMSTRIGFGFFLDFVVVLCVVANLIFSAMIKIIRERERSEALLIDRNKFLERQDKLVREKEEEKYRSYQKSLEFNDHIQRINHDLIHHFNFLLDCDGLPQKARDYINGLKGIVDEASHYFDTGSSILDLILEEKCKQAERLGIKFKVMGDFSNGLDMEPASVSIVFGNLLNNAMEGASKVKDDYRAIEVMFYQEPHHRIYISISNTADTSSLIIENGKLKTSKKDKKMHGIGLDSVKREIQKYNGRVMTTVEDNRFIIEVIVPVH